MITTFTERLKAVDQTILTPLARQAVGDERAEVLDWSYQPLGGGGAQAQGVQRHNVIATAKH